MSHSHHKKHPLHDHPISDVWEAQMREGSFLAHDQLLLIDRQLRVSIRARVEDAIRKLAEPAIIEAVDEAMQHVSSTLSASQSTDYDRTMLNLSVNLSLKVSDD